MRICKNKNFRTVKLKINAKGANHEGIYKNLFEKTR